MSYCFNPNCHKPQNPDGNKFCQNCGSKLLLREHYRAFKLLGQGNFGRTFLGVDEDKPSKPRCVIKQFYPQAQGTNNTETAAKLFDQQAARLEQLGKHPQIPDLVAYFTQDGRQYLVQEFIDGQNLGQIVEEHGAFNEQQVRDLLNSLLPVLEFIHSRQVIHRDIKPENIIRQSQKKPGDQKGGKDESWVLVDFGAAKLVTTTALLKTGTKIGTPEYAAPEQAMGKAVFASDLYSLGLTCIYLLTRVSPFEVFAPGENISVWRQYLVNNPVSDRLSQILDQLVQPSIHQRYPSAMEVLKALNPAQARNFAPVTLAPINLSSSSPQKQTWRCVYTLTGHTEAVNSIAIAPDEQTLASGSTDGTIKLWNLQKGQEIRTFGDSSWFSKFLPNSAVIAIAITPDGQTLVGVINGMIKLWQFHDGQEIRSIGDRDWFSQVLLNLGIACIAISPDGTQIAGGRGDGTIYLWQIQDGRELGVLTGHTGAVNSVAFSPQGNILASGSADKTIKLWQLSTGRVLRILKGHRYSVNSVAFGPDRRTQLEEAPLLVSGGLDGTVKLWQVEDGREICILTGHTGGVNCLAFSLDGRAIASGSYKTINLWQLKEGLELTTLTDHTDEITSIAFSADGSTLVSSSSDKTINIWRCD